MGMPLVRYGLRIISRMFGDGYIYRLIIFASLAGYVKMVSVESIISRTVEIYLIDFSMHLIIHEYLVVIFCSVSYM